MAVEVESTSQIEEFLGVLKRRLWWILVPAAVLGAIGTAVGIVIPKKYVSTTRIMVRDSLAGLDPQGANSANTRGSQVAEHQITSRNRITAVLEGLRWPEYLELARSEQADYVKKTQERIDVEIPPLSRGVGQQVVGIEFAHTDPDHAYQFLDALQQRWKEEVLERGRASEIRAFEQLKGSKERKEKERQRISDEATELRKRYAIPPPSAILDKLGVSDGGNPLFGNLAENRAELTDVSDRIATLKQRIKSDEDRYARMEDQVTKVDTDRGSTFGKDIRKARQQILELQVQREERKYLPEHPTYKAIQESINSLEEQIQLLESSQTADIRVETWVPNKAKAALFAELEKQRISLEDLERREKSLTQKVAAQREHSLELQEVHANLREMEEDLYRIQNELEEIDLAYQKKERVVRWIDGPGGDPFEILNKVYLPTNPTEPNPTLIIAFALFLGLGLGGALAILMEYRKNCFRSVHDISRVMVVPVLGTVNSIVTRGERARRLFGRVVTAGATLGFVGLTAYVTWAWSSNPHLLSDQVIDAIESFRSRFK